VKSYTTASFRDAFKQLSKQIQKQARKAYGHFQADPNHPSLRSRKSIQQSRFIPRVSGKDIEPLAFSTGMKLFGSGLDLIKNTNE